MNDRVAQFTIDPDKPVLVAGASGFVGSHTAKQLVAAGRKVRVLLRKTSSTSNLDGLDVEICYGDVLDVDSLRQAMHGCSSVFYCVVDTRSHLTDSTPLFRNNVDGAVNAMEAALAEGVERFIFCSSMATLGLHPERPVTEEDIFNWMDRAPDYIKSRVFAEDKLMQYCRERGLPGIALCVANTYGPEDVQPTPHGGMLRDVARGTFPAALDCGAPMVDIRDAAQAMILAESYGRAGERYIIANEFVTLPEFYGLAARKAGVKPPKTLPIWLAYCIAWINERISALRGISNPRLAVSSIMLSQIFKEMDNSKARLELGWEPRPVEETVGDAVAWFAANDTA